MKNLTQILKESDYNYLDNEPEVQKLIKQGLKIPNGYRVRLNLKTGRGNGKGSIYYYNVEKEKSEYYQDVIGVFSDLQTPPTKDMGSNKLVEYKLGKNLMSDSYWVNTQQEALNNIIKKKKN